METVAHRALRPPVIISCSFGVSFTNVYEAIPGLECFFFSNNPALAPIVEAKGWIFKQVRSAPLTQDYRVSSLQSKYIKYLQFFDEFPEMDAGTDIVYFDHKFFIKREHIDWIRSRFSPEKSVLIRNTPRVKLNLQEEINDAMAQERYALTMPQTIDWLRKTIRERNLSANNRIMNTGVIGYRNLDAIAPLLEETYRVSWLLTQPECQIIWGCLSQAYESRIQRIEWAELGAQWAIPQ